MKCLIRGLRKEEARVRRRKKNELERSGALKRIRI